MPTYLRWLHDRGVKYVLVPDDRLDYTSARELPFATRLQSVTRLGSVRIFAVPRPTPIAPGAKVLRLTHDTITLSVPRPGRYAIAIRKGRGERVLDATRRGIYTLHFP